MGSQLIANKRIKFHLAFVEGLNNKIRVIQRRAYGLRDEKYYIHVYAPETLKYMKFTHLITRRADFNLPSNWREL